VILAALLSIWPMRIPVVLAMVGGGALASLGLVAYLLAKLRFRSFRLTWGLGSERFVNDGIYRFSRNPQSLGWLLLLLGVGVASRSWGVMALACAYALNAWIWVRLEEEFLDRRFGAEYRTYRARVPRFIGWPWRGERFNQRTGKSSAF
jgi:protein-S-isoprenylcysteine O-methyltransferase Ste14